jgi:predicted RecA/RadA family phage recombinase
MAKNATQLGDILSLDPGATVSSGDLISVGTLPNLIIGVAIADGVSGTACPVAVKGVFDVPKTTGAAWVVGASVYFDGGTGKGSVNADGSPAFGVCVEAAGSSATSGKVRLINSGADFAPRVLSNGQVAFTASNTATATVAARSPLPTRQRQRLRLRSLERLCATTARLTTAHTRSSAAPLLAPR